LVLVAKILQKLANGVTFGEQEHYMAPLNSIISQNIPIVQGFLSELAERVCFLFFSFKI
jgi:hypothetical protein